MAMGERKRRAVTGSQRLDTAVGEFANLSVDILANSMLRSGTCYKHVLRSFHS